MTKPRKSLISVADTPYYHVINRCVRRAFLCGVDHYSGQDYSHRRAWLVNRINQVQKAFCIDVCAYAVMSNHYHLVLYINTACELTNQAVAERWGKLFHLPEYIKDWLKGRELNKFERIRLGVTLKIWRERLYSISWFMKCINEVIARQANIEDGVTGRFWQGRFTLQALLDEKALLQCMIYVDLNPIRAAMCQTLQTSEYTSIQQRIHEITQRKQDHSQAKVKLLALSNQQNISSIKYNLDDYLTLADWTGRAVLANKRGYMPSDTPKLLQRLGINQRHWVASCIQPNSFYRAIGSIDKLKALADKLEQNSLHGIEANRRLFG